MSSKIRRQSSSMILSLPDDIIIDILARVSRFNYPTLSLVSKHLRSLVASPHLYERRSLLGCTEACIYSVLFNLETRECHLYILHRKANNNNRLVPIPSLSGMHESVNNIISWGSKIYALGGEYNYCIDCLSHKMQSLPSMPMRMICKVADIIDGKIYVIGRKNVMLVFNTETQMWESEMTKLDMESGYIRSRGSVVIGDKMYMSNYKNSFVYMPKENKLEKDEMLNLKNWENACVIDDILYYYDPREKSLRAYNSKQRRWEVVKGLESLPMKGLESLPDANPNPWKSNVLNYGEKLVLLSTSPIWDGRIWCAEIALERRQGGEIWGNVEWVDEVMLNEDFILIDSLSVMV